MKKMVGVLVTTVVKNSLSVIRFMTCSQVSKLGVLLEDSNNVGNRGDVFPSSTSDVSVGIDSDYLPSSTSTRVRGVRELVRRKGKVRVKD